MAAATWHLSMDWSFGNIGNPSFLIASIQTQGFPAESFHPILGQLEEIAIH